MWNAEALAESKEIILCEVLIDAMTFWCAGFRNETSCGVKGFPSDHLAAFRRHQVARVLIAYDRDEAGDVAADKRAKKLMAEGMSVARVDFRRGMDANDYACKVKPAEKSLGVVVHRSGSGTVQPSRGSELRNESKQSHRLRRKPSTKSISQLLL